MNLDLEDLLAEVAPTAFERVPIPAANLVSPSSPSEPPPMMTMPTSKSASPDLGQHCSVLFSIVHQVQYCYSVTDLAHWRPRCSTGGARGGACGSKSW